MSHCLIDRFMAEEANDHVRNLLVSIIEAAPSEGTQYFTFNAFNVLLDFDHGSATVEDELDVVAICRLGISDFAMRLRASAGGFD